MRKSETSFKKDFQSSDSCWDAEGTKERPSYFGVLTKREKSLFVFCIVVMMVGGGCSPLFSSAAFSTMGPVEEGGVDQGFSDFMAATWFKYTLTFILAVSLWGYDHFNGGSLWSDGKRVEQHQTFPKRVNLYVGFSAVFDLGFTLFQRASLTMARPANVQMLTNMNVLFCAGLRMIIPRQALFIYEFVAAVVVTVGLIATSFDELLNGDATNGNQEWLGILLAILAALSKALQVNVDQKLIVRYKFPQFKYMTISAAFALCFCIIVSAVLQTTGTIDMTQSCYQVTHSTIIFLYLFLSALTACLFNLASITVQVYATSLHRQVYATLAVIFSWLGELALRWRTFAWLTLAAEIFIAGGIIMFLGAFKGRTRIMNRPVTCGGRLSVRMED